MNNNIMEAIKASELIRTGNWINDNGWGEWTCSACNTEDCGAITDRFCPKCGAFMLNHEPERRYRYFCKHCGAEVTHEPMTVVSDEDDEEQRMRVVCPSCHEETIVSYADAEVETLPDDFDASCLMHILDLERASVKN